MRASTGVDTDLITRICRDATIGRRNGNPTGDVEGIEVVGDPLDGTAWVVKRPVAARLIGTHGGSSARYVCSGRVETTRRNDSMLNRLAGGVGNDYDYASTDYDEALLDVLADRFSAGRFDPDQMIRDSTIDILLKAAGRAPSAGNSQPWGFILGRRGGPIHERMCRHLARSSKEWAPEAGLLLVNLAQIFVEDTDMEYSEFARYDLGQAVAHLSVQAHSMGMSVHQFRAFDRDKVAAEFDVPAHWEVTSMAAVGRPHPIDPVHGPSGFRSSNSRERLPTAEITWAREIWSE